MSISILHIQAVLGAYFFDLHRFPLTMISYRLRFQNITRPKALSRKCRKHSGAFIYSASVLTPSIHSVTESRLLKPIGLVAQYPHLGI